MADSSQSSAASDSSVRVRINHIDHVMAKPTNYDNSALPSVPVIRIFGDSTKGVKTCVHVHQVFPYIYVEYTGSLHAKTVNHYLPMLKNGLNQAIAATLKRNPDSDKSHFVRKVILVKGVHLYGFHCQYSPFLKIYLADPQHVQRAVTILQSGSIMATTYRVYESHLSFILQFLVDFGLYGCGLLNIGEAFQRGQGDAIDIDPDFIRSTQTRQTSCGLELDIVAGEILNRRALQQRLTHHRLHVHPRPPPSEPLVPSVKELWEDERNRRAARGLNPSPELPVDPSASSRGKGGDWISEARWWELLGERLESERTMPISIHDHRDKVPQWERFAPTLFESIEAVWEDRYKVWKPRETELSQSSVAEEDAETREEVSHKTIVDVDILNGPVMSQIIDSQNRPEEDGVDFEDQFELDDVVEEERQDEEGGEREELEEDDDMYVRTPSPPAPNQLAFKQNFAPYQPKIPISPAAHTLRSPTSFSDSLDNRPTKRRKLAFEDDDTAAPIASQPAAATPYPLSQSQSQSQSSQTSTYDSSPTGSLARDGYLYEYARPPPMRSYLLNTLEDYGVPMKVYREPHYSKAKDIPNGKGRNYGGITFHMSTRDGYEELEEWHDTVTGEPGVKIAPKMVPVETETWEYAGAPPSRREAIKWMKSKEGLESARREKEAGGFERVGRVSSQIQGPTQITAFKASPMATDNSLRQKATMSSLALEIFVPTRAKLMPDSTQDPIAALFYAFQQTDESPVQTGTIALIAAGLYQLKDVEYTSADDEFDLINQLIDLVTELDPDILTGWEVQNTSWGYVNKRADTHNLDFLDQIGRGPSKRRKLWNDQYAERHTSTLDVTGRHVLNMWRIIRSEFSFRLYTFEACVHELLHKRVPRYSYRTLTSWFSSSYLHNIVSVVQHMIRRAVLVLEIVEATDIVTKTAEFARVFGVDFFSVISRGSQFKVESFVSRLAKSENLAMLSPSKEQVGSQNAAECMPLVMEPQSAFYSSPLVVLDFQSLYPSVMIAYNLCYTTCLGRVSQFQGKHKFGVTDLEIKPGLLERLKDHIFMAPNGIMYVKQEVRQGLLGRMLKELLDTRVMVKAGMKAAGDDKTLHRILNARQLGLKFIANVTYGYTGATFSGRMPSVEIADSIVQTGRETLEKAVAFIESEQKWGAKIVYGDTDSLFVYLPGKTKDQAFKIGHDMAAKVTALNPDPIKLKFEKVYHPCILLAKKRYVGFKYENIDDKEPEFEAKGIETVRRDGVPAQAKMVERCLKILFRTQDLSQVKAYCCDSWQKVLEERASVQDFIFAKEVKMGTYHDNTVPQPGAMMAAKKQLIDSNSEVLYGDRLPYVIVRHPEHRRLVEKSFDPIEFVNDPKLHLDAHYYIEHMLIPPLDRFLKLVGADVHQWYRSMPRKQRSSSNVTFHSPSKRNSRSVRRVHIDDHFRSIKCIICGHKTPNGGVCKACLARPHISIPILNRRIAGYQERYSSTHQICCSCSNRPLVEEVQCVAVDCSWMFARKKAESNIDVCDDLQELVATLKWKPKLDF